MKWNIPQGFFVGSGSGGAITSMRSGIGEEVDLRMYRPPCGGVCIWVDAKSDPLVKVMFCPR